LWDYKNEKPSKDVKMVVAKAVSSFMNSNGGILLVGIDDDGTILGLKEDLAVLHKSRDEFERTFKSLINTYLNKMCGAFVNVKFEKVDDKELAVIYVKRSTRPVYFRPEGRKEEFYIRLGNSCEPLDISEANLYIKDHWPNLT
jgi:predicted HTH transcriptional regulator